MTNNVTTQKETRKRQIFSNTSFLVNFHSARDRLQESLLPVSLLQLLPHLSGELSRACLALGKRESDEIIDNIFGFQCFSLGGVAFLLLSESFSLSFIIQFILKNVLIVCFVFYFFIYLFIISLEKSLQSMTAYRVYTFVFSL